MRDGRHPASNDFLGPVRMWSKDSVPSRLLVGLHPLQASGTVDKPEVVAEPVLQGRGSTDIREPLSLYLQYMGEPGAVAGTASPWRTEAVPESRTKPAARRQSP